VTLFDVEMLIACLLVPFALAAGILFIIDRLTLRKTLSAGERKAVVDSRTGRWLRYYGFFFFIIAVIALFVNAFNLGHESVGWRVAWFLIAGFVVLSYLSKSKDPEGEWEEECAK
jgi:MFS family permease